MKMLTDLFSTHSGLMSLAVIGFMLGMVVWFYAFFQRKMDEDERNAQKRALPSGKSATP